MTDCRGVIKVQTPSCFCNQNQDCSCYGARNAELVHNAEQLPDKAQKPRKASRQRVRVCKKTQSGNKRTKKQKQQTEEKAEENDSSCLICNGQECDDQEGEQRIKCNKCLRWAHELCVPVTDSQFFFCDFCVYHLTVYKNLNKAFVLILTLTIINNMILLSTLFSDTAVIITWCY